LKRSIYIETTIPSYATSKRSTDTKKADRQNATLIFWENERHKYDLYLSAYVIDECRKGDPDAISRRIQFLKGVRLVPINDGIAELADIYMKLLDIPPKSVVDSRHLAISVLSHMDILLTWNFTHMGSIAEAKLRRYNEKRGLWTPYLLTPENLLEGRLT